MLVKPEQFPPITVAQCPLIPSYPITVIYGTDPHVLIAGAHTLDAQCVNAYDDTAPPASADTVERLLRHLKRQRRALRTVERLWFAGIRETAPPHDEDPPGAIHVTAKHATIRWGSATLTYDQLPDTYQRLLVMLMRWHAAPCLVCVGPEKLSTLLTSPIAYIAMAREAYNKPMVLFTKSRVFIHALITTIPALCQFYRMPDVGD